MGKGEEVVSKRDYNEIFVVEMVVNYDGVSGCKRKYFLFGFIKSNLISNNEGKWKVKVYYYFINYLWLYKF